MGSLGYPLFQAPLLQPHHLCMKSCLTCESFQPLRANPKTRIPIFGECRHAAPVTDGSIPFGDLNARFGKFPLMMADGWCGDYRPRPQRGTP